MKSLYDFIVKPLGDKYKNKVFYVWFDAPIGYISSTKEWAAKKDIRIIMRIHPVQSLKKLFEIYQEEANSLIEKRLTFPALDFVLKCSHCFNLLDARGVISVTDRAQYIEKIRKLAREVASAWVEEREYLDYPLIKKQNL